MKRTFYTEDANVVLQKGLIVFRSIMCEPNAVLSTSPLHHGELK